ncbi:MAG: hypothetical protein WB239_01505, partial [Acidimicrobiia bacterium]
MEAGPTDVAERVGLETYRVTITSHRRGDKVLEGVEESFTAVTDPPGLESEIRWLASTKYGASDPVMGTGESFAVQFDSTFGLRNLTTGLREQWLGVKADNATFAQDGKQGLEESFLALDPDWGFDPLTDTPEGPPPGPAREVPSCDPDLQVVVDPNADVNQDGFPDIVALVPAGPGPSGCTETTRYCVESAPGVFEEVGGPVLQSEVPIPVAAISNGCAGSPPSLLCPELTGDRQAQFCDGIPPEPNCLTVTLCPVDGGWNDPADPTVRHVAESSDQDEPPDSVDVGSGNLFRVADLLMINPCIWEQRVRGSLGISVGGNANSLGREDGASCTKNDECRTRICDDGMCGNPYLIHLDEGNSKWNVSLDAGLERGRAQIDKGFFPSIGIEVETDSLFDLQGTVLGEALPILELDATSQISTCGYEVTFRPRVLGRSPQMLDPDLDVEDLMATTPAAAQERCLGRLEELRMAERHLNEQLHDALIAWAFYRLAGPAAGTKVSTREEAQAYLDAYQGDLDLPPQARRGALQEYLAALDAFEEAQDEALNQMVTSNTSETEIPFRDPMPPETKVSIGPFSLGVEIEATGKVGIESEVVNSFQRGRPAEECGASEGTCFRIDAESAVKPRVAVEVSAYAYGVFGIKGFLGVEAGTYSDFVLADLQLPLLSEFGLARTTTELEPPPVATFAGTIDETALQPMEATFTMPYAYGSHLGRADGRGAATL